MDGEEQPDGSSTLRTGTTDPSVTGSDPVELQRLYVDRRAIGHGVGATLMRASLDAARSAGHGTIWLGVWERNARAISFYERWQFETVWDYEFQPGSDHQTDLIMARPVPGAAGQRVPANAARGEVSACIRIHRSRRCAAELAR